MQRRLEEGYRRGARGGEGCESAPGSCGAVKRGVVVLVKGWVRKQSASSPVVDDEVGVGCEALREAIQSQ